MAPMIEKRAFRRRDAGSAPGTLLIGDRTLQVVFDNISLIGARVRAGGEKLPPVGSTATLNMHSEALHLPCKVVGLDDGEFYRLKFDILGVSSLQNLMNLMARLSGGEYDPGDECPGLVLNMN